VGREGEKWYGTEGKTRRKDKKDKKEREEWEVAFWNVVGLYNKDREFWEKLKRWDVMVLMETWVEKRGWERVRNRLPKGYSWGVQGVIRKGRRGRARGGMIMVVRKELVEEGEGGN